MNERMAAGLFAGLSGTLIVAELLIAALFGFDPGLTLFCLAIYLGASGLLFSLRILFDGRGGSGVESVSERRARAKQDKSMGRILEGYSVDEEFLEHGRRGQGSRAAAEPARPAPPVAPPMDDEALKAAVKEYADMVGGLEKLRLKLESIEESAFQKMARSAGMSGVTREQAMMAITELAAGGDAGKEEGGAPAFSISLDRETFDDYIKRCMTEGEESHAEGQGAGFSIGLDEGGLSGMPSEPPTDFSHSPKAVFEKLNRPGGSR